MKSLYVYFVSERLRRILKKATNYKMFKLTYKIHTVNIMENSNQNVQCSKLELHVMFEVSCFSSFFFLFINSGVVYNHVSSPLSLAPLLSNKSQYPHSGVRNENS
jgi:hypothetical protein